MCWARLGRTRSIAPTNIHHPPPKPETPKPTQFTSRVRRRLSRPLKRKHKALVKKLKKAKKEAGPLEKPAIIKTHLRDLVITPELIGSIVAIYNGKVRPRQTVVDPHAGDLWRGARRLICFFFPSYNHTQTTTALQPRGDQARDGGHVLRRVLHVLPVRTFPPSCCVLCPRALPMIWFMPTTHRLNAPPHHEQQHHNRPVKHGRPGIGSTNSSRFIPLK